MARRRPKADRRHRRMAVELPRLHVLPHPRQGLSLPRIGAVVMLEERPLLAPRKHGEDEAQGVGVVPGHLRVELRLETDSLGAHAALALLRPSRSSASISA